MAASDASITTTTEHRVGSAADVRAGKPTRATIGGQRVALFAMGEDIVATNGRCPHASGPLHEGEVDGDLLTCPWHGWQFNLRTGICEEDPEMALQRYPVRIDGDDVLVKL